MTTREAVGAVLELIAEAKHEPVTVTKSGAPSAVVVSYDAYQRLTGQVRRDLLDTMHLMRAHAMHRIEEIPSDLPGQPLVGVIRNDDCRRRTALGHRHGLMLCLGNQLEDCTYGFAGGHGPSFDIELKFLHL